MKRSAFLLLLPFVAVAAVAAEPPVIAVSALERLDAFDESLWSFTKTTDSSEGHRVERHDATRPEGKRWTLVEIDGSQPTKQQIEEYQKEKEEQKKQKDKSSDDDQDVDLESLRLSKTSASTLVYNFRPEGSGMFGSRLADNVVGTLVVNRAEGWAERFELRSERGFRPIPGVSISEFRLALVYRKDQATSEIVPDSFELRMKGRAFMLKSIDEARVTRFSDFVRLRPSTSPATG